MLMLSDAVAEFDAASTTRTVKLLTPPFPLGVPEIVPDVAFKISPIGRLPAVIDHVNGGTPPVAESVALYGAFWLPSAKEVVVIARGEEAI
jgi:hypothetical protein